MERDSLYQAFHPNIGADERRIEGILLEYIDEFRRLPPFDPHLKLKKSLQVLFPDIPENQVQVLDVVHEHIKTPYVRAGLMVGQFHARCDVRGIHNPGFRPSRSPYPLVAMRHMETHDIVFLADGNHPEWFAEYNARFGDGFKDPDKLDEKGRTLLRFYVAARKAYIS